MVELTRRFCRRCGTVTDFYVKSNRCAPCKRRVNDQKYLDNPDYFKAKSRDWRGDNPDKYRVAVNKACRKRYYANIEGQRARVVAYHQRKPEVRRYYRSLRRGLSRRSEFCRLYAEQVKRIYAVTPEGHDVDHIVPLRGVTHEGYRVCGLHVPWNLRYLPSSVNASRCNRMTAEEVEDVQTLRA